MADNTDIIEQSLNSFNKVSKNCDIRQVCIQMSIEIENYEKEIQSYETQLASSNLSSEEKVNLTSLMDISKETLKLLKTNLKNLNKKSTKKSNKSFLDDKHNIIEIEEVYNSLKVAQFIFKPYSFDNKLNSNNLAVIKAINENFIELKQILNKSYKVISNHNYDDRNKSLNNLSKRIDNFIIFQNTLCADITNSNVSHLIKLLDSLHDIKSKIINLKTIVDVEIENTIHNKNDTLQKDKLKNTSRSANSKYSRKDRRQQERQKSKKEVKELQFDYI